MKLRRATWLTVAVVVFGTVVLYDARRMVAINKMLLDASLAGSAQSSKTAAEVAAMSTALKAAMNELTPTPLDPSHPWLPYTPAPLAPPSPKGAERASTKERVAEAVVKAVTATPAAAFTAASLPPVVPTPSPSPYTAPNALYLDLTFYVRIYPGDKAILRMKELLEWIEYVACCISPSCNRSS
jgi:hypothetical protein